MAKILERGAAAVAVRTAPDCMMAVLHADSFDVFPLREDYRCTPQSVASHTLYENADPFELKEPSVTLRTMTTSKHGSATPSASGRMKSSPASTAATA
jgi:hypothetical protein